MGSRKKKKMTARYSKERIENTKEAKSHPKKPEAPVHPEPEDTGIEIQSKINGKEEIAKGSEPVKIEMDTEARADVSDQARPENELDTAEVELLTQGSAEQEEQDKQPAKEQEEQDKQPAKEQEEQDKQPVTEQEVQNQQPSADQEVQGEQPATDQEVQGEQPSTDQEVQGEQPSADQEVQGEQPATDHEKKEEFQNQEAFSQKSEDSMETQKKFPWKKAGLIAGGSIVGIAAVVYISGMIYLRDKFFVNTTINGIDASYSTVEEIEKKIADMVKKYSITLSERGNARETISADQIGYHYVTKGEVEGFKSQQKMYAWPASFFQQADYYFESSTAFDQDMLYEAIDALKCFSKGVEVAPKNAYMKFNGTTYEVAEEKQGKKVSKKKLRKTLSQAIEKSEPSFSLEEEGCYVKPKVTTKDRDLNQLVENMNRFAEVKISYNFGDQEEVLDGSIISKWLSYDKDGNVSLDDNRIALYVDYLAERYDTYGKPREFRTHDGSYVTVEGGKYGWLIDREAETAELTSLIYDGAQVPGRDPVYAQTAVSRHNSDLGDDYVEVDLTRQHLWMYIGGRMVVSSDFVSGTYTNYGRRTPPGTFTLYYKKSPAVLKSNTPGDSYENPVTYWMPFNGGIGLHDANWRGSFGGEIYRYSGSHGCINLPTGAAGEIYEQIYAGMPVICFYR